MADGICIEVIVKVCRRTLTYNKIIIYRTLWHDGHNCYSFSKTIPHFQEGRTQKFALRHKMLFYDRLIKLKVGCENYCSDEQWGLKKIQAQSRVKGQ